MNTKKCVSMGDSINKIIQGSSKKILGALDRIRDNMNIIQKTSSSSRVLSKSVLFHKAKALTYQFICGCVLPQYKTSTCQLLLTLFLSCVILQTLI